MRMQTATLIRFQDLPTAQQDANEICWGMCYGYAPHLRDEVPLLLLPCCFLAIASVPGLPAAAADITSATTTITE